MTIIPKQFLGQVAVALFLVGCANTQQAPEPKNTNTSTITKTEAERKNTGSAQGELPHVLVFTKTMGYRHKNISDGIHVLREIGNGLFVVDQTEDAGVFTTENLKRFCAVVFLSTTGNVLNTEQQKAFEQYIHSGGGFVGIHSAADTEFDWPWYGQLVGAWFKDHT